MAETLKDRIGWAMEEAGVSQADLARACKISPVSVNNWLSGRTQRLQGENLLNAARKLNVDPRWLATGRGRPERLMDALMSDKDLLDETMTSGLASPPSQSVTLVPQILLEAERWVLYEEGPIERRPDGSERLLNPYAPLPRAERLCSIYAMIAADGGALSPTNAAMLIEAARARLAKGRDEDERRDEARGGRAAATK